jgi:tetratricopeptide (TPR) repeat protein
MESTQCNSAYENSRYPKGTILALLFLVVVVCACYANSLSQTFVSDDFYIVQLNRDHFSLDSILKCFTSSDYLVEPDTTPYYRPINRLSYILEQEFFHLNPAGYHVDSILLHAISSVLVCLVLLRLSCTLLPSLGAALLFALHPVNSEAVNLLAARNNILATIFILGSYLAFLHAEETSRKSGYILSGILFFLGALSKETALMFLPFLFYLKTVRQIDLRRPAKVLKAEMDYLFPYVIFLCVYLALRYIALDHSYHLAGLPDRLGKLIYILPKYLTLVVLPLNQSYHYSVPDQLSTLYWPLLAGWAVIAAIIFYLVKVRTDIIEFGFVWLILNFLPISNIVPIPSVPLADRYLYIPLVGLTVIVADRLHHLCQRPGTRKAAIFTTVAFIMLFGSLTWKRNFIWQNDLAFAADLVRTNPGSAESHYVLGEQLFLRGDQELARKELGMSLKLDPAYMDAAWAYYYLAVISLKQHDKLQAELYLRNAEKVDRVRPPLHFLLGSLYTHDRREDASREYGLFLRSVMPDSSHLIPEARNGMLTANGTPQQTEEPKAKSLTGSWKLYHRFASRTKLYYDSASVTTAGDATQVSVRHHLGSKDRFPYAMKFIKYPLACTAEVRYRFEIKCPEHIYKTTWCEFRDKEGKLLGEIDAQKEDYVKFLYPPPGTPMDDLLNQVCVDRGGV